MKTIYVYTGEGAYQAKDVENFLAVFGYDYERIHENNLSKLNQSGILIVPGGEVAAYLPAWGQAGISAIKNFVEAGGIYIGICAGAYVAGKSYANIAGLNVIDKILERHEGQTIVDVTDNAGEKFQLIHENGPDLSDTSAGEVVLRDNDNQPRAIKLNVGQGQVYLFAAHPEGSVFYRQYPQDFSGAKFFDQLLKRISV